MRIKKNGVLSDLEAAEVVCARFPHMKYDEGELHVFYHETGLYDTGTRAVNNNVKKCRHSIYIMRKTKEGHEITEKSYGNMTEAKKKWYVSLMIYALIQDGLHTLRIRALVMYCS